MKPNPIQADELTIFWQVRALKAARGRLAAVLLSVVAHSWPHQFVPMLHAAFPDYGGIAPPFLSSAGKITANGKVVADMVTRAGRRVRQAVLYESEAGIEAEFRTLADRLRFTDVERVALFGAVKRWIVCDYRLDPTTGEKEKAA